MSKHIALPDEIIISKIYFIRGEKVMIDRDLAELYGVETKYLKRQVKRNMKRFPDDFMFTLTSKEFKEWRSQFVTSNQDKMGLRYAPYAFTEDGVGQLSTVLNSERAISVNLQIIRLFSKMRKMLLDNTQLRLGIEEIRKKTENNTKNIELVFQYLDELLEKTNNPPPRKQIGYKQKGKE